MTHRDRASDPSGDPPGRREAAGDAGHRQGFPTPAPIPHAAGSPARPERRFPQVLWAGAFGRPMALRRGTRLPMSRIATPRACSPKALGNCLYESLSALLGFTRRQHIGFKPHRRLGVEPPRSRFAPSRRGVPCWRRWPRGHRPNPHQTVNVALFLILLHSVSFGPSSLPVSSCHQY